MTRNETKILNGIRVLSLALNVPGPVAALKLSHLGASVTKIEPPDGDPLAKLCPLWYENLCRGEKIMRLDLKTQRGREEIESMLEVSDLFLTSFRPSSLARLSLEWAGIHSRHPRLCQVAIVGYSGEKHNVAGHDLNYLAPFGLLTPPLLPRTLLADLAGAERAVSSALSLLYARERGHGAGYCEVALSESADLFAEPLRYGITSPGGMLGGGLPQYNLYETRQGWIAVAALEPHFRDNLFKELGLHEHNTGYKELAEIFLTKTAHEWEAWALSLDLPLVAVR